VGIVDKVKDWQKKIVPTFKLLDLANLNYQKYDTIIKYLETLATYNVTMPESHKVMSQELLMLE
jgi:hypothetical protein